MGHADHARSVGLPDDPGHGPEDDPAACIPGLDPIPRTDCVDPLPGSILHLDRCRSRETLINNDSVKYLSSFTSAGLVDHPGGGPSSGPHRAEGDDGLGPRGHQVIPGAVVAPGRVLPQVMPAHGTGRRVILGPLGVEPTGPLAPGQILGRGRKPRLGVDQPAPALRAGEPLRPIERAVLPEIMQDRPSGMDRRAPSRVELRLVAADHPPLGPLGGPVVDRDRVDGLPVVEAPDHGPGDRLGDLPGPLVDQVIRAHHARAIGPALGHRIHRCDTNDRLAAPHFST